MPDSLNDQLGGEEETVNLANLLTFRYDDGKGTTREWKLAPYGTTENSTDIEAGGEKRPRYIYKLLPSAEQQIPVRLEITDPETGSFVLNDELYWRMKKRILL